MILRLWYRFLYAAPAWLGLFACSLMIMGPISLAAWWKAGWPFLPVWLVTASLTYAGMAVAWVVKGHDLWQKPPRPGARP